MLNSLRAFEHTHVILQHTALYTQKSSDTCVLFHTCGRCEHTNKSIYTHALCTRAQSDTLRTCARQTDTMFLSCRFSPQSRPSGRLSCSQEVQSPHLQLLRCVSSRAMYEYLTILHATHVLLTLEPEQKQTQFQTCAPFHTCGRCTRICKSTKTHRSDPRQTDTIFLSCRLSPHLHPTVRLSCSSLRQEVQARHLQLLRCVSSRAMYEHLTILHATHVNLATYHHLLGCYVPACALHNCFCFPHTCYFNPAIVTVTDDDTYVCQQRHQGKALYYHATLLGFVLTVSVHTYLHTLYIHEHIPGSDGACCSEQHCRSASNAYSGATTVGRCGC